MVSRSSATAIWRPSAGDIACMMVLALLSFLAAIDSTILLITRQLHGTTIYAFWTGTSYLMTSAIAQPFISTISERLGIHMRMIWFSVSAFAAGSIICALSRDFIPLLAGRSLQGLGGGGIITLVQIIFARLVPLRERPKWFSIVLTTWAVGSVVGPFLGSVLTTTSTFHWIFWINLPICGLALVVIPFTIPSFRPTAQCSWSKVDWAGGAIFFTSLTSVLLGLSWGGVTFPWTSKWTISSVTLGFCGTLLFGIWEHNFPKFPIFRPSLFNTASRIALYFCSFLQGLILFCLLYYVPLYFASAQQQTPMVSSACVLPLSCSLLPGAAITSQVITRTGHYKWILGMGWILTILGSGLLLLFEEDTGPTVWILILLIIGIGNGCLLSALNYHVQATTDPSSSASGASMYTFFRSLGMCVGVTVGGNVFQNVMAHVLSKAGVSTSIAKDAEAFIYELTLLDNTDTMLQKILHAYVGGLHGVFYMLLGVSILGLMANTYIYVYSV
ncbi:hypothetical protein PV08_12006 [Exophiala spinifera]|uniref:Major facilitator superfamily (MFS) profile domain-containing protein n=1 Tax=Exophiala spinifera TaxID=91928 RepID=A0A0D1Z9R5_9EURO|nr:uncharacterized protein PV08_12006 [Exophiala spinifera]KIW09722.1 hypothetical protein PV08_12006 [Exophiala spinifera]